VRRLAHPGVCPARRISGMGVDIRRDIKVTGAVVTRLTVRFVPEGTGQARGGLPLWREDLMA